MEKLINKKSLIITFILILLTICSVLISSYSFTNGKLKQNKSKAESYTYCFEDEGSGVKGDPWVLSTFQDMQAFEKAVNPANENYYKGYYILSNDIDLSGDSDWWVMSFDGHFDGNGYCVYNINLNYAQDRYHYDINYDTNEITYYYLYGFIGNNKGTITNLGVNNIKIYGFNTFNLDESKAYYYFYLGGICGDNNGTVKYCYNTKIGINNTETFLDFECSTFFDVKQIGGIVGDGTVYNSINTASIKTKNFRNVGGICGYGESYGSINTGEIQGEINTGGIVGYSNVVVNNINIGKVVNNDSPYFSSAGGIAGHGSILHGNRNLGEVEDNHAGLIVGYIAGEASYINNFYLQKELYPINNISDYKNLTYGDQNSRFCRFSNVTLGYPNVDYDYFDITNPEYYRFDYDLFEYRNDMVKPVGLMNYDLREIRGDKHYYSYILTIENDEDREVFRKQGLLDEDGNIICPAIKLYRSYWNEVVTQNDINSLLSSGNGTQSNPYKITTELQMASLIDNKNLFEGKYFKLENDLNFDDYLWQPIEYKINLDGSKTETENYTISNVITFHNSSSSYDGGFIINLSATIKNVLFVNIFSTLSDSFLEANTIDNVYIDGYFSGNYLFNGINILNSISNCEIVDGSYIFYASTKLFNCCNNGVLYVYSYRNHPFGIGYGKEEQSLYNNGTILSYTNDIYLFSAQNVSGKRFSFESYGQLIGFRNTGVFMFRCAVYDANINLDYTQLNIDFSMDVQHLLIVCTFDFYYETAIIQNWEYEPIGTKVFQYTHRSEKEDDCCYVQRTRGRTYYTGTKTITIKFTNPDVFYEVNFDTMGNAVTNNGLLKGYTNNESSKLYINPVKTSSVGIIPIVTKEGKDFQGWFTSKNGGSMVINAFGEMVVGSYCVGVDDSMNPRWNITGNITLYPSFEPQFKKVKFDANGGNIVGYNCEKIEKYIRIGYKQLYDTINVEDVIDYPIAEKEGYIFNGWYTYFEDGIQIISFDKNGRGILTSSKTSYTTGGFWNFSFSEITIFAQFEYIATIKFETGSMDVMLNGVDQVKVINETDYVCDADLNKIAFPTAEKEGYDFIGWYTKLSGGEAIIVATKTGFKLADHSSFTFNGKWNITKDTVLYPHFSASVYKITFDAYNGYGATLSGKIDDENDYSKTKKTLYYQYGNKNLYSSNEIIADNIVNVPLIYAPGFRFLGWQTDNTKLYNENIICLSVEDFTDEYGNFISTKDIVLTGLLEEIYFIVEFKVGEGTLNKGVTICNFDADETYFKKISSTSVYIFDGSNYVETLLPYVTTFDTENYHYNKFLHWGIPVFDKNGQLSLDENGVEKVNGTNVFSTNYLITESIVVYPKYQKEGRCYAVNFFVGKDKINYFETNDNLGFSLEISEDIDVLNVPYNTILYFKINLEPSHNQSYPIVFIDTKSETNKEIVDNANDYYSIQIKGNVDISITNILINIYTIKFLMPKGKVVEYQVEHGSSVKLPKVERGFMDIIWHTGDLSNITNNKEIKIKRINTLIPTLISLGVVGMMIVISVIRKKRLKALINNENKKIYDDFMEKNNGKIQNTNYFGNSIYPGSNQNNQANNNLNSMQNNYYNQNHSARYDSSLNNQMQNNSNNLGSDNNQNNFNNNDKNNK